MLLPIVRLSYFSLRCRFGDMFCGHGVDVYRPTCTPLPRALHSAHHSDGSGQAQGAQTHMAGRAGEDLYFVMRLPLTVWRPG